MSLRQKLQRLKPHISHEQVARSQKSADTREFPYRTEWEKEGVFPYYIGEDYCLIREREFSIEEKLGHYPFSQFIEAVAAWNQTSFHHPLSAKGFNASQLFFFDTETTGLGGGAGNTIFLLGYASVKEDKVILKQHLLTRPGAEIPLYQSFLETIDYTTLVTYNGKAFDWPQVKTRHTLIREHVPKLPSFGHFDLFHAARRLWKHRLERLKLPIVEKEVLGIDRGEDIPGFLAPMIYFDFVESQNPEGILGILKHNEKDILSLITLYTHISFQLLQLDQKQSLTETYEVGRWYASIGERKAATETLQKAASSEHDDALKAKLALSYEWKKARDWDQAITLWEELADAPNRHFSIEACVELAKYYEHQQKDFAKALQYTKKAGMRLEEKGRSLVEKDIVTTNELHKREARLQRKIARSQK